MYFRDWVEKLLSCKSREADLAAGPFPRQPGRLLYLIYWTLTYPKMIFFEKTSAGALVASYYLPITLFRPSCVGGWYFTGRY